MWVQSLGWEDPLEKDMAEYSMASILAWRSPWTEEPGGLQSMGSQRVGHDSSDLDAHKPRLNRHRGLLSETHRGLPVLQDSASAITSLAKSFLWPERFLFYYKGC